MELNEIKKLLYKRKPTATIQHINKDGIYYCSHFNYEEKEIMIYFTVPLNEIGDSALGVYEDAHLLIRYITLFIIDPKHI